MSRPPENPSDFSSEPSGAGSADGSDASSHSVSKGVPASRPREVSALSLIVAAEAAALLVAAGWYAVQLTTGAPVLSFWGAVFTLALLLSFSAWLFAVAYFLFRGFRWPRAGALVAQLFVLTIGFPTLTGGYIVAGLAMLVPAAVALVLLFRKSVISFASRAGGAPPAL
ncbi:hypothetical protein [Arthrobacter sp. ISL-69]|uniref:hypothetical protein n=1 Tax=Arthrobacter sp. ISL-69 TaxID=2819113 RepID=UPI00288A2B8E|nr:hypothetical protein [Arthrobacter sp. ISL-69]